MRTITAQEFSEKLDHYLELVESGEHIKISDGDKACVVISADEYELINNHIKKAD